MRRLIQTLRTDLRPGTERSRLVRAAAGTAAMKIAATGIAFVASLLYARVLGPHDYGVYAYVIAWTAVLTIPASLGFPQYLVREGAKTPAHTGWLRRWADRRIMVTGVLAGLLLALAAFLPDAMGARRLFLMAAPIPLLANLAAIRQSLIQAHGWIVRSQWPQLVFAPAFTLVLLLGLWLWRGGFQPADVVIATVVAAFVQLLINALQLGRAPAADSCSDPNPTAKLTAALPFMWLGALYLVMSRVDLILLGNLKGARDAGIYAIASRAAEFVPFFLVATNAAIAPKISHLHHSGEHDQLQRLIAGAARRLLWISLPLTLLFVLAARPLITFCYGESYADGAIALRILALAQFFTVAGGPVGILLNMTEHAAASAKAFAVAAALNVLLNFMLIPDFGYTGAATATAISIALCNGLRWYWVRHHLQIRPSAFGV